MNINYLITINSKKVILITQVLIYSIYLTSSSIDSFEATLNGSPENRSNSCSIYKSVGVNDLSINDIVVKSPTSDTACIKARFSLAIKVEALIENSNNEHQDYGSNEQSTIILGYLPLDSVLHVEDSCPLESGTADEDNRTGNNAELTKGKSESDELNMIVSFDCGKLAFNFRKNENFYLNSIKGVVNLDSTTMREFISEKPMFFTSDLSHHFLYNDLIEFSSSAKTKAFILSANFYNSEIEVFRNTSSRDFIRPPDEKSKPFLD